ncbi:DUF1320 domain-containing protein [Rhodobacter capsulatus]|uniref:DUF1320 domain-containing protein n=1 Tax=Rhodobacter capsulatus TaxID=1061 RepID=A0A4U1K2W9_RHOCA|nr:DUF1320 domain-containing protein [Rhodobacter capsulatus]TKD26442.1 DUF1320 domain-containing protein [Rhodobacter capsulatus]
MAYTTQADLITRYGEPMLLGLTDLGMPASGQIDSDMVARAISDADAFIDGYLRERYVVPLASPPPEISAISAAIAIWKLHSFEPGKKIEIDYRDALAALKDIAKGLIKLDAATVSTVTTGSTGAMITDRERPFTEANMKGFI